VFSSSCDQDKKKKKATEVTRGGEAVWSEAMKLVRPA
jgi:hypothetical protein